MSSEQPVVKEYQQHQIEMRGPGAPNAKPWVTGNATCILRFEGEKKLSLPKLAALFNAAAKDYPSMPPQYIKVFDDHIEFCAEPKADYKKLPPKTIAARG